MLPFFAALPKLAVMIVMLNQTGWAIPGEGAEIDCTTPQGVTTVSWVFGDFPVAQVPVSAVDCTVPPGYVKRFW